MSKVNYKFKTDGEIIEIFRDEYSFYWFDKESFIRELDNSNILIHLCHKNWFNESLFYQLLTIAKECYPKFNFDKIILEAGKVFHLMSLYDNPNYIEILLSLVKIKTFPNE